MRLPLIATILVAVVILFSAVGLALRRPAAPPPDAGPAPDFALVRSDGRPFPAAELRGRLALVYFGYTTCPDICPTELGWMTRTLRALGDTAGEVQPVFITIDPERDTPAKLGEYAALFDARLLALTGSPEQVAAAAKAFGVAYQRNVPVSAQPGFYLMDHTMTTFVLDRQGRIVLRLQSRDRTPAEAAALIRPLIGAR